MLRIAKIAMGYVVVGMLQEKKSQNYIVMKSLRKV